MALHHVFVRPDGERIGRLGPKTLRTRDLASVHIIAPDNADAIRAAIREGNLPSADLELAAVPVVADALPHLRKHEDDLRFLIDCALPGGLRTFLSRWSYVAEGGLPMILADTLWEGQDQLLDAMLAEAWLYALKGRQVGATTLQCAANGHHVRFGFPNARAHLFSRREDEAIDLLEQTTHGLDALPEFLQLPITRSTSKVREYSVAPGDRRTLRAFPADRATGRGQTCTLAHVDEWSAMAWPKKTLASITPSVADSIGRCVILTTETIGPESESAEYWRQCEDGAGKHTPIFISSTARADRKDPAWLEGMRRSMTTADFNREYPTSAEQALEAAAERMFSSADLDVCSTRGENFGVWETQAEYEAHFRNIFGPNPRRRYSIGVDIGLKNDATVLCLVDVSDMMGMANVIGYRRLLQPSVAEVQRAIQDMAGAWPSAHVTIEASGIGFPIIEGVSLPESRRHEIYTTGKSKPRMLGELQYHIEKHLLRYSADDLPQLDKELRGFRLPDTFIVQDSVMAISFALAGAEFVHDADRDAGRILAIIKV